jgi:hypothetical protein
MFSIGDTVDYHGIIDGPVTSMGHEISHLDILPSGEAVAWITKKAGCVSLKALSYTEVSSKPTRDDRLPTVGGNYFSIHHGIVIKITGHDRIKRDVSDIRYDEIFGGVKTDQVFSTYGHYHHQLIPFHCIPSKQQLEHHNVTTLRVDIPFKGDTYWNWQDLMPMMLGESPYPNYNFFNGYRLLLSRK